MKEAFVKDGQFHIKAVNKEAIEALGKIPNNGEPFTVKIIPKRNSKFHRKIFALLRFAHNNAELQAGSYKGKVVKIPFEVFRNDVTILAGYKDIACTLGGDVKWVAHSLEYGKCSQKKAEAMYSTFLDVVGTQIFSDGRYTKKQLDEISERFAGFC